MEKIILNDIRKIEERDYKSAEDLISELISKYRSEISHIELDIDYGEFDFNDDIWLREPNNIANLNNIKGKLEIFLAKIKANKTKQQQSSKLPIQIVNTNNSSSDNHSNNNNNLSNNNTIDLKLMFEDARRNIDDDISLNDSEVTEILEKITELEDLYNSDEKPRGKWYKSKEIMGWIMEKGPKVASTILPLITEVIK